MFIMYTRNISIETSAEDCFSLKRRDGSMFQKIIRTDFFIGYFIIQDLILKQPKS